MHEKNFAPVLLHLPLQNIQLQAVRGRNSTGQEKKKTKQEFCVVDKKNKIKYWGQESA